MRDELGEGGTKERDIRGFSIVAIMVGVAAKGRLNKGRWIV